MAVATASGRAAGQGNWVPRRQAYHARVLRTGSSYEGAGSSSAGAGRALLQRVQGRALLRRVQPTRRGPRRAGARGLHRPREQGVGTAAGCRRRRRLREACSAAAFGGSAFSGEAGLSLVDQVDGGVLLGGQLFDVGASRWAATASVAALLAASVRSLNTSSVALLRTPGAVFAASRVTLATCSRRRRSASSPRRTEELMPTFFGFDATQAVGVRVRRWRRGTHRRFGIGVAWATGDLLLALLERSFGSVSVG